MHHPVSYTSPDLSCCPIRQASIRIQREARQSSVSKDRRTCHDQSSMSASSFYHQHPFYGSCAYEHTLFCFCFSSQLIQQNIRDSETNEVKFYNGQQGEITAFAGSSVWVKFAGESEPREVNPITEVVYKIPQSSSAAYGRKMPIVSRQQLPLSISKAITIHKSQGQTLKVVKVSLFQT